MSDPKQIWLSPACEHPNRVWCDDDVWDGKCDECDEKSTRYVLGDEADAALAAKDARIAELESENSHLRRGMTGDYDLDAWLEWCVQKDATPSEDGREVLRLVELLGLVAEKAFHLADNTEEQVHGESSTFIVDGDDFQALSDALDKCDDEPEIDDAYVRDGWLTVLDKLRALLVQPKEGDV